jgi:hypothetical protein
MDAVQDRWATADRERVTSTSRAPRLSRFAHSLLAVCAAAVITAGCGSAQSGGSGAGGPERSMPSGSLLYIGVNLDTSSAAWKQFAQVGRRFPGWRHLVGSVTNGLDHSLQSSSGTQSVTFAKDVQPWLGPAAGLAVTSLDASTGKPQMAFVVDSTDDSKALDFLHSQGDHDAGSDNGYTLLHSRDGKDHLAVGDHAVIGATDDATLRTVIGTRSGTGGNLGSDAGFTKAMAALPADSVLRGWVNTQKLSELAGMASLGGLGSAGSTGPQLQQLGTALHSLDSLTFAAWATSGGYHLAVHTTLAPGASSSLFPESRPNGLTFLVPSDAFAFLAFGGYGDYLKQAFSGNASAPELRLLQKETGLSLTRDLLPLFSGDDLAYAAPGVPFRVAVVLRPASPGAGAAARTMRKLTTLIARSDPNVRISSLHGVEGQRIRTGGLVITWQRAPGGLITIGNDPSAGRPLSSPLVESAAFNALLAKAGVPRSGDTGVPSSVNVAAYFDVAGLLRMLPVSSDPNLHHVGAVVAWTESSGQDRSSNVFVEVR